MTTTSRIFSTVFLPADATRNNAPAHSEVAQSLAGRARLAWETVHGVSAVSGEAAGIPLNPQGMRGIDLSGPPFGPCLLLPVAHWRGKSESGTSPSTPLDAVGSTKVTMPPWRVWNRAHATRADGNAPLQRLQFQWRGICTAGASVASTFVITIVNVTTGTTTTITRSINTTARTSYDEAALIPMVPGANDIIISFVRTTSTRVLTVTSMTLAVAAKRRHGLTFPG